MKRLIVNVAIIAFLAACGTENGESTSSDGAASEPKAAVAPAGAVSFAAGERLELIEDTPCPEPGKIADEQTWDVAKGSDATYVEAQGDMIVIEMGSADLGLIWCLIPANAVKRAET